jgi:hypothetical protein
VAVRGGVEMGTNGLAKVLAMLREELAQAQDEGAGHQFRFESTEGDRSRPPCPLQ